MQRKTRMNLTRSLLRQRMLRAEVSAYQECLSVHGLSVVPDMIERRVCLPQYGVAGKFDRVLLEADGSHAIGDFKSGQDLSYSWLEIAIQLACYAHGINRCGVWDARNRRWIAVPPVRTDYAVVVHVPAGSASCTMYRLDIQVGWEAVKLCADVRDMRNQRHALAVPYEAPLPQKPVGDAVTAFRDVRRLADWEARFGAVQSKQEAATLYREARRIYPEGSAELASLVRIGQDALRLL